MKLTEILIKPVVTEKATSLAKNDVYLFEVHKDANKYQIKKALQELYEVKVGEVRINIRKGRTRKVGKRMVERKLSDRKIAYIKIKEGKIDLFPKA